MTRWLDAWRRHLGAGAAVDMPAGELQAWLSAGTLAQAFHETARATPDRPALSFHGDESFHGDGPETTTPVSMTHGELDHRAARLAGWLAEHGIAPGDRVMICAPNLMALVVAYVATLRAGAAVVLANPAYTEHELRHLVDDSGARLAFASGPAAATLGRLTERVVRLDEPLPAAEALAPVAVHSDSPALLAYTSGTTGVPKGVPLTHANLLSSIRAAMLAWRWSPDDVLVHSLPLSHQHGLGGVHATLLAGSRAAILTRFDAARLTAVAAGEGATVLFAVPAIYERLGAEAAGLASLRLAVSGSAPLGPEVGERIRGLLGQLPLERYGTTESGLDVSNPYDGPRVPGTVGLPLPGVEVGVVDSTGTPLPDGTDGEIVLRGPQVFAGYWQRAQATREAFFAGGWFRTGDLGRVEEGTGYLTITGRSKELIITGGLNVYPREVELALERHPAVAEAAVAGVPSQRWGERVTAWVVLRSGTAAAEEELLEHARGLLAAYKCPKHAHVVDSLPRNSMGKVLRRALTEPPDTAALDRAVAKLWRTEIR